MRIRSLRAFVIGTLCVAASLPGLFSQQALAQVAHSWQAESFRNPVLDRIVRRAVLRYRGTPNPDVADHTLLALVLEFAARERSDDLYLWRRCTEAWRAAGDTRRELSSVRQVLRLSPSDTVAQLRLLTATIEQKNTVEERLKLYGRMLGQAGARLDPSVRSRLALDAALLHQEQGDEALFLENLTLSAQLDSTNIDAATLVASVGMRKTTEPLAQVELLANVVLADPLQHDGHLALADAFVSHGAYAAAQRFFDLGVAVARRAGVTLDEFWYVRSMVADWGVDGPKALLDLLQAEEAKILFNIGLQERAAEEGDLDPADVMEFTPLESSELIQFFLGLTLNDEALVAQAFDRLATLTQERIDAYGSLAGSGEASDQEIAFGIFTARTDLIWLALLANHRIDEASDWLDGLATDNLPGGGSGSTIARLQGLLVVRRGDFDAGLAILTPLVPDDVMAHVGLALMHEEQDAPMVAARSLAHVVQERAGDPIGMWARSHIETLLGQSLRESKATTTLESYALAMPTTIDRFVEDPSHGQDLSVVPVSTRLDAVGRMELRIALTNTSVLTLGAGEQRPISTRMLCAPRLSLAGQIVHALAQPEVVQMGSVLRLLPGQSIEETVWVGAGQLGGAFTELLYVPATVRWRVMQGFVQNAEGRNVTGAHSVSTSSDLITRSVEQHANAPIATLVELLTTGSTPDVLSVLMVSGNSFVRAENQSDATVQFQLRTALSTALASQFISLPGTIQALHLLHMPTSNDFPELRRLDDVAKKSTDPLVQLTILLTRVTQQDDPFLLHVGQTASNPILLEIADVLRSILRGTDLAAPENSD